MVIREASYKGGEFSGVLVRDFGDGLFDGRSKLREGGMITTVQRSAFGQLPESLARVSIG